jgi:hypothetical protein
LLNDAFKIKMQVDEDEIYWRHGKEDEELEWSHDSTRLIAQLTQCFCEYNFSRDLVFQCEYEG